MVMTMVMKHLSNFTKIMVKSVTIGYTYSLENIIKKAVLFLKTIIL